MSISKVRYYLALWFFDKKIRRRIFLKITPRNETYTLLTAGFIWYESTESVTFFRYYYQFTQA